jgi:hypothetical protein
MGVGPGTFHTTVYAIAMAHDPSNRRKYDMTPCFEEAKLGRRAGLWRARDFGTAILYNAASAMPLAGLGPGVVAPVYPI